MGTPDFAVPSLERLYAAGYPIAAVVTGPDKPRGRGRVISGTPVKDVALRHATPVLQPDALTDPGLEEKIRSFQPDLIVVVAFRILPPSLYKIPRLGSFNLHASLLPRYRGAAPINWAIINGENETGVTTFFLEDRVDTGNIILQARTPIGPEEDAGDLHHRLSQLGAEVVLATVQAIEGGKARVAEQDPLLASKAPKIFRDDCHINWNLPSEQVRNFIRGLSPSPAAWTMHQGTLLKIFKSSHFESTQAGSPGSVTRETGAILVACASGRLKILELQQEGHRRMTAEEFLRGYQFGAGDLLV